MLVAILLSLTHLSLTHLSLANDICPVEEVLPKDYSFSLRPQVFPLNITVILYVIHLHGVDDRKQVGKRKLTEQRALHSIDFVSARQRFRILA